MELKNTESHSINESKYGYNLILDIAKEYNFDLFNKLNIDDIKIQQLPDKNQKISILLCKKYLPETLKSLFELKDKEGNFKTRLAIKTLTNTIKETPSDPLIFMAKFAQDSFLAGVDASSVIKNLIPKDFLEQHGNEEFNKKFLRIILKRAPNVYRKYIRSGIALKEPNIASLHLR